MRKAEAQFIIENASRVVFFTGSGISAESGIHTFRDESGLWQKYNPDEFGTLQGLLQNAFFKPAHFADFLHDFLAPISLAQPNLGHFAIAELGRRKDVTIITQNVDGLHQRSGSDNVLELHGSVLESRRLLSTMVASVDLNDLHCVVARLALLKQGNANLLKIVRALNPLVRIGLTGVWLPHLILFGQMLPPGVLDRAAKEVRRCDCLVVVGTSLNVLPAAELVSLAHHSNVPIIHVDLDADRDHCVTGRATEVLPAILARD